MHSLVGEKGTIGAKSYGTVVLEYTGLDFDSRQQDSEGYPRMSFLGRIVPKVGKPDRFGHTHAPIHRRNKQTIERKRFTTVQMESDTRL